MEKKYDDMNDFQIMQGLNSAALVLSQHIKDDCNGYNTLVEILNAVGKNSNLSCGQQWYKTIKIIEKKLDKAKRHPIEIEMLVASLEDGSFI